MKEIENTKFKLIERKKAEDKFKHSIILNFKDPLTQINY